MSQPKQWDRQNQMRRSIRPTNKLPTKVGYQTTKRLPANPKARKLTLELPPMAFMPAMSRRLKVLTTSILVTNPLMKIPTSTSLATLTSLTKLMEPRAVLERVFLFQRISALKPKSRRLSLLRQSLCAPLKSSKSSLLNSKNCKSNKLSSKPDSKKSGPQKNTKNQMQSTPRKKTAKHQKSTSPAKAAKTPTKSSKAKPVKTSKSTKATSPTK